MHRFWFQFNADTRDLPLGLGYGLGVTAASYDDALRGITTSVFEGAAPPEHLVVTDVDVRNLDQRHVVPNMDDPTLPGVWYPRGYR